MDYHLEHGIKESVEQINRYAVGKQILRAEAINYHCPSYGLRIFFTDGSSIEVSGEHDEGVIIEYSEKSELS